MLSLAGFADVLGGTNPADLQVSSHNGDLRECSATLGEIGIGVLDGIQRAVENLVTNAERHGVRNGQPPSIIWSMRLDPHDVTLQVSDDGPGIPEAMRTELFERFRSNDPHGSGVGLWLVRWIVEQHGGTISAESNNGAVITARFPQGVNSPPSRTTKPQRPPTTSVAEL